MGTIGVVIGTLGTDRRSGRAAILHRAILFQSSFLILALVYFPGRSVTPTIVTEYSFIAAVVLALLAVAGLSYLRAETRSSRSDRSMSHVLVAAVTVIAVGFPLAAWSVFPSPQLVVSSLQKSAAGGAPSYLDLDPTLAIAEVPPSTRLPGLVTVSGTARSLRLGVAHANLFLRPDYLTFPGAAVMQRDYLATLPGDAVVMTDHVLTVLVDSDACRTPSM